MTARSAEVDRLVQKEQHWLDIIVKLRTILLDCGLTEALKWGQPCYAVDGGNILVIQSFKKYCALLFFKGVLMQDPDGILVKTGENTRVGRQIRFSRLQDVVDLESSLKAYVAQAVELEKSGAKVELDNAPDPMPEEFLEKLRRMPALKDAFDALTPGRRRAYLIHFSSAKQAKTREARIEKCVPLILDGLGMDQLRQVQDS